MKTALWMTAALALATSAAAALPPLSVLTKDKIARTGRDRSDRPVAWVRVGRDPQLATFADPTDCRNPTTANPAVYQSATSSMVSTPELPLACERWKRTTSGYRYTGSTGETVRRARIGANGLLVDLAGPAVSTLTGPAGFVQL